MPMNRFPLHPYPRGWYQAVQDYEVKPGQIKSLHFFGRDLVVFRGSDKKARVFDAHCPHLGAHIGKGGRVVGNNIRCPFHGWEFDASGQCVKIPYCDHIPKRAQFSSYPTKEVGNGIYFYYSETKEEPAFDLPACAEFGDKSYSKTLHLRYRLQSHVQEMAENTVDTGHFPLVHQYFETPTITDIGENGPQFTIRFTGSRKIFGIKNFFDVELDSRGLGFVYGITKTDLLQVRAIHCATPVNDQEIEVNVSFVFKKSINPLFNVVLRTFLPRMVFGFTSGDHMVLNYKKYREKPLLCRNDGPIIRLRHWARQFYPEIST